LPPVRAKTGSSESPREEAQRIRLAEELKRGVGAAAALGGTVEAAIMLDGWRTPVIASSEARGDNRFMRMWSMSKVVAMIAVLRGLGWAERAGRPIPPELAAALRGALTRSENCRQRRVVLELQRLNGGKRAATAAIADIFRSAGASELVMRSLRQALAPDHQGRSR
jgi:hypothetical protein